MAGFTCTGFALGLVILSCDYPEPVPDVARFCQTVESPIKYSSRDTDLTRRQLRSINAKWRALCTGRSSAQP